MRVLVTGARGFIGKNLLSELKSIQDGKARRTGIDPGLELLEFDLNTDRELLDAYAAGADFVFHLAGVNRPQDPGEFETGNVALTDRLLELLRKHGNACPVMLASSTQAALDNAYGRSKRAGEELFFNHGRRTGARVLIYRFPNVFGKWSRPDYNSAVATFCHCIARGLPVQVRDPDAVLTLAYIDDVVDELLAALAGRETREGEWCVVPVTHRASLGQITGLLQEFRQERQSLQVPDVSDAFTRKLYATWTSFLPEDRFAVPLVTHADARGSFTEVLRTPERGQLSVNITRPGITKGNHWHHSKCEKFIVASGVGVIRFRKVGTDEDGKEYPVLEQQVSGERIEAVDIPAGYTHSIRNLSETEDLVTVMWASEPFDPQRPDTYFLEV